MNIKFGRLRTFNLLMAVLHAAQGIVIIFLATDSKLPVTAGYLDFDLLTESLVPASKTLFEISLVWLVVAFFFMSALAHLSIATFWRKSYEVDLQKGMNRVRWIEYALSASTMMVAIALLVGIYELSALIMIFSLIAFMNLMGLMMEVHNQATQKTNWLSFLIGCFAGIVPWIVVGLYFWAAAAFGSGEIPTFVYWIYGSIFVFFNCFAINMFLQYKRIGKWKDYVFGEQVYIILSLVAKSALAWQVFAGTLRP